MMTMKKMQRQQRTTTPSTMIVAALIVMAHQMLTTSATSCHIISARPAFYPHTINSVSRSSTKHSASTSSTRYTRRQNGATKSAGATDNIQTAGLRKKTKSKMIDLEDDFDYSYNPQSESAQLEQQQPSLEELRSQLGPLGLLVSNTIELTIVTVGSFISGSLLGYVGGGVFNIPSTLFGKSMGNLGQRLAALNAKAFTQCKSWGKLSAAFSGFNNFARMCRGNIEDDGWNTVIGSGLTGAFLSRNGGPQAMLQGAATYAGFTYFLDKMTRSDTSQRGQSELMYTDVPLDD